MSRDVMKYSPESKALRFDNRSMSQTLKGLLGRILLRPQLKIAQVESVQTATITIKFPRPDDVDIPGVTVIGWGSVTAPNVGDYVYVLHIEGSNPIAIGKVQTELTVGL